MDNLLKKIHWSPKLQLTFSVDSQPSATDSPWLAFSQILPGLFVTCEETICNRTFAQENGSALILALNGGNYVAPYRVYEYSSDLQRCIYTKLPSFDIFLTQLDSYTSSQIPEDIHLRKVFIRSVSAEDSPTYDISRHFAELCTLIELVMLNQRKNEHSSRCLPAVVVHCLVGVSRSVAVVLAYIMKRSGCSRDEALLSVRKSRSIANPNPGFLAQLSYWEKSGHYRVADKLAASITAHELCEREMLQVFMKNYFPLILHVNKMVYDREFFGLVLAEAGLDETDLCYVLKTISNYISSSISDEVFLDVPFFFSNVCEIIASLARFVPSLLAYSDERPQYYFDDALYFGICKSLAGLGSSHSSSLIINSFCSLLQSIDAKHLSKNPSGQPRSFDSTKKKAGRIPEELKLSFPFLPFLAPFAAGFVQQQVGEFGNEHWTTQEADKKLHDVLSLFRDNFLLTASGSVCSSSTSMTSRWHASSRLRYLEFDMEVKVMEGVERGATLSKAVGPYICLDQLDLNVCMVWIRKLAGAVVGTRFFYDAVDRYFTKHYGAVFPPNAERLLADRFTPWQEVSDILQSASKLYAQKCGGEPPDLLSWIKEEMSLLVSNGTVAFPNIL